MRDDRLIDDGATESGDWSSAVSFSDYLSLFPPPLSLFPFPSLSLSLFPLRLSRSLAYRVRRFDVDIPFSYEEISRVKFATKSNDRSLVLSQTHR